MSHTSDDSARDILNFITQHGIDIPVIASHSNFRAITTHARNLPDDVAQEIIKRGGLIGLNFVAEFVGSEGLHSFLRQIEYAIKIGAEKTLCFGADFFHADDGISALGLPAGHQFFHQGFDSSACYPKLIELMEQKLHLSASTVQDFISQNVMRFQQTHI